MAKIIPVIPKNKLSRVKKLGSENINRIIKIDLKKRVLHYDCDRLSVQI
jgi:hypothetical protein